MNDGEAGRLRSCLVASLSGSMPAKRQAFIDSEEGWDLEHAGIAKFQEMRVMRIYARYNMW